MENPPFIVVKARDSNCVPTSNMLLEIHQTDSKERHYSIAKGEAGICDYSMGILQQNMCVTLFTRIKIRDCLKTYYVCQTSGLIAIHVISIISLEESSS